VQHWQQLRPGGGAHNRTGQQTTALFVRHSTVSIASFSQSHGGKMGGRMINIKHTNTKEIPKLLQIKIEEVDSVTFFLLHGRG
jgi:hypothetical protein